MVSRNRRNRIAIIKSVLSASIRPIQKTYLMYASNLNHKTLNEYLDFLLKKGMIEQTDRKFVITKKGTMFLQKAEEYEDLLVKAEKIKKELLETLEMDEEKEDEYPTAQIEPKSFQ